MSLDAYATATVCLNGGCSICRAGMSEVIPHESDHIIVIAGMNNIITVVVTIPSRMKRTQEAPR